MPGKKLEKFFRRRLIMNMKTIQRLCKGRSKRSLFRDLSSIGYLSSYSHAGRFYTLVDIPRFDNYGLWHYEQVSFSKNGTLKSTIHILVEKKYSNHWKELFTRIVGKPIEFLNCKSVTLVTAYNNRINSDN